MTTTQTAYKVIPCKGTDRESILEWFRAMASKHGEHPRLLSVCPHVLQQAGIDPKQLTPELIHEAVRQTYEVAQAWITRNNKNRKDGGQTGPMEMRRWFLYGTEVPVPDQHRLLNGEDKVLQVKKVVAGYVASDNKQVARHEGEAMNVTKTVACKILKALGFKADVAKWDVQKLTEKVNDLPRRAGVEDKRLPDDELNDILHDILADLSTGKKVKVEEDDEVEVPFDEDEEPEDKPTKKDKGKKGGKKPKAEDNGTAEKPPKKAPKEKKAGVIATIIEILSRASAKKPVSKADILEGLVARFPDRPESGMKVTVNAQLYRLKDKLDIQGDPKTGYWIGKEEEEAPKPKKGGKKSKVKATAE